MAWKRVFRVIAVTAVCTLSLFCFAQNTDSPSLGEIARQKKIAATAKAKRVVTDENLGSQQGPIPSIALEGVNNAEEIVAAVREFKKHHNEIETEEAVRLWYDDADNIMLKAIDEQSRLTARKEDRNLAAATGETFTHPSDYRAAVELRNSEIRQDRSDYRSY